MYIHQINYKDALQEKYHAEYKQGMDFFFLKQLVPLNLNIYYVEKIIQFPFHLFAPNEKGVFLRVVAQNLNDYGLVIITRLATDQQGKPYTLLRFKNKVRDMLKSTYVELFDNQMKLIRFDSQTRILFEKARDLRNEGIVHLDEAIVAGNSPIAPLSFTELKQLRDALNTLLDALAFDTEYMMLPVQYNSRVHQSSRFRDTTDIEEILDSIAQNSDLLNMPEKHPRSWKHRSNNLSLEDKVLLNQFREKFGLAKVDE